MKIILSILLSAWCVSLYGATGGVAFPDGTTQSTSAPTGGVSTNGGTLATGDIAAMTGATTIGKATSANLQSALGNVYQATNSVLTQTGTNSYTGTGTMPLSSVTDPKASTNSPVFLTSTNSGAFYVNSTINSQFNVNWTNNTAFPYETFTSSGSNITSAINSSTYGVATCGYSITSNHTYEVIYFLTLNSGTAPFFASGTSSNIAGLFPNTLASSGTNRIVWTATRTGTDYLTFWEDTGVSGNFSVSQFNLTDVNQGVAISVGHTSYGQLSAPENGTSERFGANASNARFAQSTVVGNGATSGSKDSVVIGYNAVSSASGYANEAFGGQPVLIGSQTTGKGVALGYKSVATSYESTAIGQQCISVGLASFAWGDAAHASNANEIVVGDVTWASGNVNTVIGSGSGTAKNFIIALGSAGSSVNYDKEVATADHQGFLGWYQTDGSSFSGGAGYANDWWIGGPVVATAPHAITMNLTGGSGSNVNGVDFTINGSKGTGTGTPGQILLATSTVGTTGSTLQSEATRLTINSTAVTASPGIGSTATDAAVAITSTGWTNSFGKNATAYLDGTGVTFTLYNNAGTSVYTNAATVTHATINLQSSGKFIITAGSGISGMAVPF